MASFELHGSEIASRDAFLKKHQECKDKYLKKGNQFGLPFRYMFTPSGVGIGVTIICPYCNTEEDITDISVW